MSFRPGSDQLMSGFAQPESAPLSEQKGDNNPPFVPVPRKVFVFMGFVLLVLLSMVPVWSAIALLFDPNYNFWSGPGMPFYTICSCSAVIILYFFTAVVFFRSAAPEAKTDQTILMMAGVFISLLGLVLMLNALPLSRQAVDTYDDLMNDCRRSHQTHSLYQYSVVLQNLRMQPDCLNKFSVVECEGFDIVDKPRFTAFLRNLENTFFCSGFCHQPFAEDDSSFKQPQLPLPIVVPGIGLLEVDGVRDTDPFISDLVKRYKQTTMVSSQTVPDVSSPTSSMLQGLLTAAGSRALETPRRRYARRDGTAPAAAEEVVAEAASLQPEGPLAAGAPVDARAAKAIHHLFSEKISEKKAYPVFTEVDPPEPPPPPLSPATLFSDAGYQSSCQGMAARDTRNFVGDVAYYMFYEGVYLVLISIGMGSLKLINHCVNRKGKGLMPELVPP